MRWSGPAIVRRIAVATRSTEMSRMQRWCPSRQTGLWQGRHANVSVVSTTAAIGLSGAQCQALVGPKIPMAGVPFHAAEIENKILEMMES